MLVVVLLVYYPILYRSCAAALEVGGISDVRFASGTGIFPHGRDGVLEIKLFGEWSSICNFGFDYKAASAACLMMGYPPFGVPILNSYWTSSYPTKISNFNCTGRFTLGPDYSLFSSVHLGYCEYTDIIPSVCQTHTRDVAIACMEPMEMDHYNASSLTQFAPVACPGNSSEVRLTHGDETSGRLEVKHPETGIWGTVCADGFGTNEAKTVCRMLCSSSDDLAYAHAVVNVFEDLTSAETKDPVKVTRKGEMPIHLARIVCPPSAQSLNECSLGDGWGSVRGCSHALDVGVVCAPKVASAPPPMPIESNLTCEGEIARVRFKKNQLGEVTPMTVTLNRTASKGCFLNFTKIPNEDNIVEVAFPMDKCGGTYERSNATTIAVHISLAINATHASGSQTRSGRVGEGELEKVFVLPITCLVTRSNSVRSTVRAVATSRLNSLVATRAPPHILITFYDDRLFQRRVGGNINILPYRRIFVRVSLERPEQSSKLILRSCMLSSNETTVENGIPVISNGCPVNPEIHLLLVSRNAVGFSFKTAYFRKASQPIGDGSLLQLYVTCQTRLCQIYETTPECIQNYCT